jgi:hypothetical protein
MNTLREAVGEYLNMRRGLGFKLREAGKGLIDFVTFLEQHNASYITQALALTWAQQPSNAQPAHWAQRLSFVREFARYRSATDSRTQIPPQGLLPSNRSGRGPICTPMKRSAAYCGPLSGCPVAMSAASCDRGSIIVYLDC